MPRDAQEPSPGQPAGGAIPRHPIVRSEAQAWDLLESKRYEKQRTDPHQLLIERLRRDLSQPAVGRGADTTGPTVSAIESRRLIPDEDLAQRIADFLEISVDKLKFWGPEGPPPRAEAAPGGASPALLSSGVQESDFDFLTDEELEAALAALNHDEDNPPTAMRVARVRRRLSLGELARLVTHVTAAHLGKVDRGATPTPELAERIARTLQMSLDELGFTGTEQIPVPDEGPGRLLSGQKLKRVLLKQGFGPDNPPHPVTEERLRRGWEPEELARRAHLKLGALQAVENWEHAPTPLMTRNLLAAMDLDPGDTRLWPIGHVEGLPVALSRLLHGRQTPVAWVSARTGLSSADLRHLSQNVDLRLLAERVALLAESIDADIDKVWKAVAPGRYRRHKESIQKREATAALTGLAGMARPQAKSVPASAVREKRLALGLSQEQLGVRVSTSQGHIGSIERGLTVPPLELAEKIAEELHLPLTAVGFRTPKPQPEMPNEPFGARVRRLRRTLRWTVNDLAARSGIDEPDIVKIEGQRRPPARMKVLHLADAFELETEEFWPSPVPAAERGPLMELRRSRGWSLDDLSARSGVPPLTIRMIEDGMKPPRAYALEDLANGLDVEFGVLCREPRYNADGSLPVMYRRRPRKAARGPDSRGLQNGRAAKGY